jgi:cytochrome c-type biogenesis protein CcmH/NrfG
VFKAQQFIESTSAWVGVIASVVTIIATVFGVFFCSSVVITDNQGVSSCSGFLIYDPLSNMLTHTIPSKEEQEYLINKIHCYRDQIQKHPKDAALYTNIGEADRRLGDLEAARIAHKTAIELEPTLQEAKIGLALTEQDLGNTTKANQTIQETLAQHKNAIAYLFQGAILHKQNYINGAEQAFQQAIRLDSKAKKLISIWKL